MALDREFFSGKTRMHALMRDFDWLGSPFGLPAAWPESLHSIVRLMLDSASPICLAWGPELRLLYNDACLPIIGRNHPAALGARMQDVWAQLWPTMETVARRALAGEPDFFKNFPVHAMRLGRPSRRWFTLACSPVHDDEARVAGLICVGAETTEQVLMERDYAFQLRLSQHLRSLSTLDEITSQATRLLGLHLGIARAVYLEADVGRSSLFARPDWTNGKLPSLAGRTFSMDDCGGAAIAHLKAGRLLKVNDSAAEEEPGWLVSCASMDARSMLAVPLFRAGGLCAILQVHDTNVHPWGEDEAALVQETAERTWAAVERTGAHERRRRAEEELHRAAARQAFQLELADLLRPLTDPDDIIAASSDLLGRELGVSRVLYADVDDTSGTFAVPRDWTREGVRSVAGQVSRPDDFGPEIIAALRAGTTVAVEDIAQDSRTAPHAAAYTSVGVRSFVTVPLVKSDRLTTVLIVHQDAPTRWSELDLQRAGDMAERTWSAVEAARAQAALRAERDLSQYVLDSMQEGFAVLDSEGRLVRLNAEGMRIGRITRQQAIGRQACDIWPNASRTALAALYRHVKGTGQAATLEYRRTSPGDGPAWIEVRAYPALGGGVAVFCRDIDERKRAEDKLKEADRRKDEFVATLAHELRNPIAPIAAAADMLCLAGIGAAEVKRAGEVISRQVGHMTDLVNDLLDISRITSGLVELHQTQLDVNDIVAEAIEQVEPLVKSHAHHLALNLASEPALVWGDHLRLVQVVANLLSNAAKYTPRGGDILVEVDVDEEDVSVTVRDNGIGMPADLVESVFELFAQVKRTSDRREGGLGIGLALVKGLVERHGGRVSAHSAGIGSGSVFRIALPRLLPPERAGPS
jgi:PAS domain S-box-containing protein